jgi:hypothetical protein
MKPISTNLSTGLLLAALALTANIQAEAQEYTFTTLAGPAEPGAGAVDGTVSTARFNGPSGVAADSADNLYVADTINHTIRKILPGRSVTTLAGLAESSGSADGTGSAARFNSPSGVAVDSAGNVYVADKNNFTIRKIGPGVAVTTIAGVAGSAGTVDGTGSAARFGVLMGGLFDSFPFGPAGVTVDSANNVYVADTWNYTIRKIALGNEVTTVAGMARSSGNADGTGSLARFNEPSGVAVDGIGNVYVADAGNYTIRKMTPGGVVTTLAGLAGHSGSADGTGSTARFNGPYGLAVDRAGNVFVADGNTIRIGGVACPDAPTIDLAVAPVGQMRQLDTNPQTAVAWQWSWIRQPAASTASLSDANVRNPTFTPDVADLYVFRLKATSAVGAISIRTLELAAVPANVAVLTSPQRLPDGSFQLTLVGQTNQSYALQVSANLTT